MPSGLFNAAVQVGFRTAATEPGAGKLPAVVVGQAAITDVFSALKACALKGVIFLAIELDLALKDGATKLVPQLPRRVNPSTIVQSAESRGFLVLPNWS